MAINVQRSMNADFEDGATEASYTHRGQDRGGQLDIVREDGLSGAFGNTYEPRPSVPGSHGLVKMRGGRAPAKRSPL